MTGNIYVPQLMTIKNIRQETDDIKTFTLEFNDPEMRRSFDYQPGQFGEVTIFGVGEAPISITSSPANKGFLELCVARVGNVSRALHEKREGDIIGFRGPYGNAFPFTEVYGKDILLVGGGIGIAPLRSLINQMFAEREKFGKITILYGCQSPKRLMFMDEVAHWEKQANSQVLYTVDRADETWQGNEGVITTLFPKISFDPSKTYAVVVGPPIMYRFVIAECLKKGLADDHIIVSLERRMECGVGKCGHCQINQQYCCTDGPVFTYDQVRALKEAV